ncbi:MAG: hypothetical protein ACRYHA_32795 [Janthinobacterium lividum]
MLGFENGQFHALQSIAPGGAWLFWCAASSVACWCCGPCGRWIEKGSLAVMLR